MEPADLTSAAPGRRRVREYSLPLEDARMKANGRPGSLISKILLLERERPGRITVILLQDTLGF